MKYKAGDRFAPNDSKFAEKTILSYNEFLGVYVLQTEGIKNPSSFTEKFLETYYRLVE